MMKDILNNNTSNEISTEVWSQKHHRSLENQLQIFKKAREGKSNHSFIERNNMRIKGAKRRCLNIFKDIAKKKELSEVGKTQ